MSDEKKTEQVHDEEIEVIEPEVTETVNEEQHEEHGKKHKPKDKVKVLEERVKRVKVNAKSKCLRFVTILNFLL